MDDVSPTSVKQVLRWQSEDPLCLFLREKVRKGKHFSEVNRNRISMRKATLVEALQWYVREALQARLLSLSRYSRYAGHPGATKMYNTLRRNYYY